MLSPMMAAVAATAKMTPIDSLWVLPA